MPQSLGNLLAVVRYPPHLLLFVDVRQGFEVRLEAQQLFEARHLSAQLEVVPGGVQLCCMLDVTLLYHEEAHASLVYEICEPLDAKDQVAPCESAERYHGLLGVQDYGAGNPGAYSSDEVLGITLVGLQVFHQGSNLATLASKPARQLTGFCLRASGRRSAPYHTVETAQIDGASKRDPTPKLIAPSGRPLPFN